MAYFPPNDLVATGNITTQNLVPAGTATAGSAVALTNLNSVGSATVQITGTWTAVGGLSFQGTLDGSIWVTVGSNPISVRPSLTVTSAMPSGINNIYTIDTTGYSQIRVTALGAVTGTAVVTMRASYSTDTVSISGVNVGSYNALPVTLLTNTAGADNLITGQATQTAASQNIVLATAGTGSQDVSGYRSIAIQIVPTGTVSSGVVTFEGSNDNVTFVAIPLYDEASLTTNPISTVSPATGVNRFFLGPLYWKYFRARISTVIGGGGSLQAITMLAQAAYQPDVYTVTQATGANLNVAVASGTVTTVSTVTSLTTLANGQTAHSSAATGSPVRAGGRVLPATPDLTLVAGDASDMGVTTGQQLLTKDYAPAELDFTFNGSISNSTTAAVFKNAAGASIRNYVTGMVVNSDTLTAATEIVIKDGSITTSSVAANTFTSGTHDYKIGDQVVFSNIASYTGITAATIYYILTVPSATTYTISLTPNGAQVTGIGGTGSATSNRILFRSKLQTTSFGPASFVFPSPLRGIPNGTLDFQCITATVAGAVYYNIQGYIGF